MKPTAIEIAGRLIGPGHPAYIVAEIGINHNGDMALARQMIDAAKDAGADAVKFQNYATEDFIADRDLTYTYVSRGEEITESQYDMFKRCELSRDQVLDLAAYCRSRGVAFHSTPTSSDGLRDLIDAGVAVLKNGSDFLLHLGLIAEMGRTGLPTVLSTGMADLADIEDAVLAFRETGNKQLVLLHCTSSYPTPNVDVNVSRVRTLGDSFECLSGFSDHSEGVTASILSVAFGACWIEKHFTTDRSLRGPDHRFSMTPDELAALVQGVRTAETQVGSPTIAFTESERESREQFRLSCVASCALPSGFVLGRDEIAFRRPGNGIPPKRDRLVIGRRLKRNVAAGHVFSVDDFE